MAIPYLMQEDPEMVVVVFPFYYAGKIYLTMKELCDEIGEDNLVVSQMLNPNSPRKVAPHLAANGLRYATDDEIKAYYQSSHT